jgi:predicted aldo/keto reductase-like oxidoreductase
MRYQFKWQDVPLAEVPPDNQTNLEACIRRSVELGINHIETARGYGSSERQLGLILPKFPREKLIVQTKVGPEASADDFTRNFEESLARLQLQHVELLAIHGINNRECLEQSTRKNGCLAAARKIQKRGLAKHIGFSTHGSTEIILEAIKHEGDGGFDYVNLHWYYIFQRNWSAVLEATKRDMGVFIISPSDKGGLLYDPSPKLVDLCKPLHPIVFNDLYCLLRPEVHTLSIGAARPTDFDRHVEAVNLFAQAKELVAPIAARLDAAYNKAVPANLRNPFQLGLPEPEATPGELNIPIILWLLNLVKAYDMVGYGQMRYNLLGNGGHWFPGKQAGELEKLDLAALAQASGLGAQLKPLLAEAHGLLAKDAVKRLSQS